MSLGFRLLAILFFVQIAVTCLAQKDSVHAEMAFDLGITRGKNINIWPLLKIARSTDEKDIEMLFRMYRFHRNFADSTKHSHLFPVYWSDSTNNGRDLKIVSTYYPTLVRRQVNESTGFRSFKVCEIAPQISLLEVTRSADGLYVQNNMLMLLWYQNNKELNKSYLIWFPVLWSFQNGLQKSLTLFPLYSHGIYNNQLNKYTAVTPLYWHVSREDGYSNVLFPLYWNKKRGSGDMAVYTNRILPIYYSRKEKDLEKHVLFPIMWSEKTDLKESLTIFPLYSNMKTMDSLQQRLMVASVFWHKKDADEKSNFLFPIWWNKTSGTGPDSYYRNVIFPIYWAKKDGSIENHVLFPIIWSYKDSYRKRFTLFPICSWSSTTDSLQKKIMLGSLFYHAEKNDKKSNVLFPIWFSTKSVDKNNKVLFPVYWKLQNPSYSSFTLMPFFSKGISTDSLRRHFAVTPFFWHTEKPEGYNNIFFPLWININRGKDETASNTNVVFPFYWSTKDARHNNKILFPFLWSLNNPGYSSLTIFPVYSKGESDDGQNKHLMATPLYWKTKYADYQRTVFFPFWWKVEEGEGANYKRSEMLFPVYMAEQSAEKDIKVFFPFVWDKKDQNYRSFTFVPFFSTGHSLDSLSRHLMVSPLYWHSKNGNEEKTLLLPLWVNKKINNGGETENSNYVFPLWWSKKDKEESKQIFFPLVWNISDRYYKSFTLFPIYSKGQSKDSLRNHTMITPLAWSYSSGDKHTKLLLPIWYYFKQGSGDNISSYNTVFPIYWAHKEKDNKYSILFPFIWNVKDKDYSSFTLAPVFSAGHSLEKDKKHLMLTPLYWHFKDSIEKRNILFPVWWQRKSGADKNASVSNLFLPVWYSKKEGETCNRVLFPLMWSLKSADYKSFTFAPLFSTGHSLKKDSKYTMFTPLLWNMKQPDNHRLSFVPIFNYYSDTLGTHKFSLLYFLARYKGNPDGKVFSFLWPLCEYNKENDSTKFRFAPIVWYKKTPVSSYFSIQPFYYQSKDTVQKDVNILWQLVNHKNYYNEKKSTGLFWKAVFLDRYDNGDYEFRFLYLFLASMEKGGKTERSFFPFFYKMEDDNGNSSLSIMLSMYSKFRREIPGSTEFYQEEKIFWFIRLRSNYKSLKERGIIAK